MKKSRQDQMMPTGISEDRLAKGNTEYPTSEYVPSVVRRHAYKRRSDAIKQTSDTQNIRSKSASLFCGTQEAYVSKVTIEEVFDIIDTEGLAYSIDGYLNADMIEDRALSSLWKKAQDAMSDVAKYIKDTGGSPD